MKDLNEKNGKEGKNVKGQTWPYFGIKISHVGLWIREKNGSGRKEERREEKKRRREEEEEEEEEKRRRKEGQRYGNYDFGMEFHGSIRISMVWYDY